MKKALSILLSAFLGFIYLGLFGVSVYGACHDNQISSKQVLHDSRDGFYRSPGWATSGPYRTGAVVCGTTVRLRLRTAANDLTACFIRLWDNDSFAELLIPMNVADSDGVYDNWQGEITFNKAVDTYYAFRLVDGSQEKWYQDDSNYDGAKGALTDTHEYFQDYSIVWYSKDFETPVWHNRAVIYQIMTDGFYNGDISNDPAGNGLSGDVCWWQWDYDGKGKSESGFGRSYVRKIEWGLPRTSGRDYYGGDFQGVIEKISYLEDLAITAVYFNPWMESPDNHGYSVNDYKSVQPYYGVIANRIGFDENTDIVVNDRAASLAVFDKMEAKLQAADIRIISDMVLNHCGAQSRFFQRFEHISPDWKIYDPWPVEQGGYESKESRWYNWFLFESWNHKYKSWWGYNNLPQIQYVANTALHDLILGSESVFDFWAAHGTDGYRLDVNNEFADGNHSRTVNRAIRKKAKSLNSGAVIIGENWSRANLWLAGDMCDGVMNYRFRDAVVGWLNGKLSTEILDNRLSAIQEDYPVAAQYASWALLGSHDTERIATVLGSAAKHKLAAIFQFSHIGPPVIWAADELGAKGRKDPDNRCSFDWDMVKKDNQILALYKRLISARTHHASLTDGWIRPLLVENDVYAYGRQVDTNNAASGIVIVLSRSLFDEPVEINVASMSGFSTGQKLCDILTGRIYKVNSDLTISLTVSPVSGLMLTESVI